MAAHVRPNHSMLCLHFAAAIQDIGVDAFWPRLPIRYDRAPPDFVQ